MLVDAIVVVRVTDEHELAAVGQGIEKGMVHEVHALLLVEPAHIGDERAAGLAQPEPFPQRFFVA